MDTLVRDLQDALSIENLYLLLNKGYKKTAPKILDN